MRYFIGNLIRGETAEYYKATCADIAARFGVENVSTIVPPHITVKSPFERPFVEAVDDIIALMTDKPAYPVTLSGWNSFGNRTIFIDATKVPPDLMSFTSGFLTKLKTIEVPATPQDQTAHFHLSVARFLKPKQFEEVWNYLKTTPAPQFEIDFDNLTIFVKENREDKAWKILKTFPLMGIRK